MDMTQWVFEVRQGLERLRSASNRLCEAVLADEGFAFYWKEGEQCFDAPARELVAEHIDRWAYTAERPTAVGGVGVSETTRALAEALNEEKARWKATHRAIRMAAGQPDSDDPNSEGINDSLATEKMRRALALAGYGDLNLDATDRLVPVLPGTPLTLRWHYNESSPSSTRSMADVLEELSRLAVDRDGVLADRAQGELARLGVIERTTPIAYRAKRAVQSVRYRASCEVGGRRMTVNGYGGNPVLFPTGQWAPALSVFESQRASGAGRPPAVSTERVSPLLPHYYWYNKKKAPEPAAPVKGKNPHASTAFPGLWLGARKRKSSYSAMVMVHRDGQAPTSVSITRLGLKEAWRRAAETYCASRPVPLEAVIEAQPASIQVDDMLAWAAQNSR